MESNADDYFPASHHRNSLGSKSFTLSSPTGARMGLAKVFGHTHRGGSRGHRLVHRPSALMTQSHTGAGAGVPRPPGSLGGAGFAGTSGSVVPAGAP